jgi:hypothetical protein
MKGILLAIFVFINSSAFMIFVLMKFAPKNKFKTLLFVHNVLALILIFLHLVTPDNLWFLPVSILENHKLADLVNSVILYQLFFWLFTANFYSLASRGFSLGMLITIAETETGRLDKEEARRSFAVGKGVDWNFDCKLKDCLSTGIIRYEHGKYYNTPRGELLASISGWAKNFLNLGQGG